MSKGGILSIFIDLKDRAERFHPSKFCGSLFNPGPAFEAADLIEKEVSSLPVAAGEAG